MNELVPIKENIIKALQVLYNANSSGHERDNAQRWLVEVQRKKEGWEFSWDLLSDDNNDYVQYYGANVLLIRIQAGFPNEIPEDKIDYLQMQLLQRLFYFSLNLNKKMVYTKICVAFTHFLLKSVATGLLKNPIKKTINLFENPPTSISSNLNDEQRCLTLLQVLKVLAEEHQSSKSNNNIKSIIMHSLRNEFSLVNQFLINIRSQSSNVSIKETVINCLKAWIAVGIQVNECQEILLDIAHNLLQDPTVFDSSIECLVTAFSSASSLSLPNTMKPFIPIVLKLHPTLIESIENEDGDTINSLTKLICSLAENQSKIVLNTITDPEYGMGLISLVMECTKCKLQYPTTEWSSPITYTFWYTFQDDVENLPNEDLQKIQHIVYPIFFQLAQELLKKIYYPDTEVYKCFNSDEIEQFRIFRIDISDTLMYMFNFLGNQLLIYIFNCFDTAMKNLANQANKNKSWQEIEACLYGIHSLLETTHDCALDLPVMHNFATMIPQIPIVSDHLAETLLYTIGTMVDWLSQNPQYLQSLVAIVIPYLSKKELTIQCVLTLKRMTSECGFYMVSYAEEIIGHLENLTTKNALMPLEESSIMQCAGYLLSELPLKECLDKLQSLLYNKISLLKSIAQQDASAQNRNTLLKIIVMLTNLFQTLHLKSSDNNDEPTFNPINDDDVQPAIMLLQQLSPVCKEVLSKWFLDEEVISCMCALFDRTIRNLLLKATPILEDVCQMMLTVYESNPHPSVLDISQRLLTIFAKDKPTIIGLYSQRLTKLTLVLFHKNYHLQNPEVAQYFFRFLSLEVRKEPALLKFCNKHNPEYSSMSDIFHCCMLTLNLLDGESVKVAANFFVDFFKLCSKDEEIKDVLYNTGRQLVEASLLAIGGAASRACTQYFADILFVIAQNSKAYYTKWIQEMEFKECVPCTNIEQSVKTRFMHLLKNDLNHKRRFKENVENLSLACRGILNTEYGMATKRM